MKTFSLVLLSLLIGLSISDHSLAEVYTTGSAADNNNNIIVIGYCLGNVRIAGLEYTITQPSAFILKLDSDGEMIWVKFINSNQSIKANAVAVDDNGNIYVTGEFSGTANFDSHSLTSTVINAFIVKYNSSGFVEWIKRGISSGIARGNDISIKGDLLFTCGYGNPIMFDSLTAMEGGFTVIHNIDGNIVNLFQNGNGSFKLTVDSDTNIIVYTGQPTGYYPRLNKYSLSGNLLWEAQPGTISKKLCTDENKNIFVLSTHPSLGIWLQKFDTLGNVIIFTSLYGGIPNFGSGITLTYQNKLAFCGYYSSGFQFGDSTLQSNGFTDFFLAVVDTSFSPIWIKHGGGIYEDDMNSVSQLNDGNIVCTGNFSGTIHVDTFEITGGISVHDKWVGIAKYDANGNLIFFKNIVENFSIPSPLNWFPLEVGNKIQYLGDNFGQYYLNLFQVSDSVWINNKKYYLVSAFPWLTEIRYDENAQTILVLYQDQEYLYMDFSKDAGETFMQIQHDGSFRNTTIIDTTFVILGDTIEAKGFYNSYCVWGGATYMCYYTWYYFAPEIGWCFRKRKTNYQLGQHIIFSIENLTFKEGQTIHKKHSETATLIFEPVNFIPSGDSLFQNFIVLHPFSKQNVPASSGYFSYINAYLESFYFNGSDTIWTSQFNIQQTTEKDFVLNYQFDTTKYQQGYHLYYRIAAVDKGIVPDTFYSPQSGYYKLFWKDSTTSVSPVDFLPSEYSLSQNFPNPFNPSSRIVFTIPERNFVSLKVFDLLGSEIISLVNEELDAGRYEVDFSGDNLSSGVYIYQIRAGSFIDTKKMILLR